MREKNSPPITATPKGEVWSPLSPRPMAIGIMPAIMAILVIRMGRSLEAAACRYNPLIAFFRLISAIVRNNTALAMATPTAMIMPM